MGVTLYAVVFDCTDAAKLAGFWADVLGRLVDDGASEEHAMLGAGEGSGGPGWMFVQVPEAKQPKNRVHVDLVTTDDLDAEIERVVGLSATQVADQQDGEARWTTLSDPEGNELDLAAV